MSRVLLAGETWTSHGTHVKGFGAYTTGFYFEGAEPLTTALTAAGHTITHLPNHLAPTQFPATLQELGNYEVVILSDIPADTVLLHPDTFERGQRTVDRLQLLSSWVSGGGGLLMVGGYMSFSGFEGKARYQNTALAEVLPVTMLGYDDRIEAPAGVVARPLASHAVLAGIAGAWPPLLGYNRVEGRADALTLLAVGDDPLLVVNQYGRGRSAAFTSDCSPHWAPAEFTGWEFYGRFWSQLVAWLAGTNQ